MGMASSEFCSFSWIRAGVGNGEVSHVGLLNLSRLESGIYCCGTRLYQILSDSTSTTMNTAKEFLCLADSFAFVLKEWLLLEAFSLSTFPSICKNLNITMKSFRAAP